MLKEIPIYDRPREKVIKDGIASLSNQELLAVLLHTGTKDANVMIVARQILSSLNQLSDLKEFTLHELLEIKGIGKAKAITLLSAIELGKRISMVNTTDVNFTSAIEVYNYILPMVEGIKEENLYAIYLNAKGGHIATKLISKGGLNSTLFDPKLILKWAFKLSACALIVVHNHPSGDPTPSLPDIKYTKQLIEITKLNGFVLLDHIVIGNYPFSMKKELTKSLMF